MTVQPAVEPENESAGEIMVTRRRSRDMCSHARSGRGPEIVPTRGSSPFALPPPSIFRSPLQTPNTRRRQPAGIPPWPPYRPGNAVPSARRRGGGAPPAERAGCGSPFPEESNTEALESKFWTDLGTRTSERGRQRAGSSRKRSCSRVVHAPFPLR